jgi:hypothetical protein
MADLLATANEWLASQQRAHASREVSYQRGALSATLLATIGRTVFELQDAKGFIQKTESRDYLITTSDLVLAGQTVLPERGDKIVETVGNQTFTYEVLAPGREPVWRFSDPFRTQLRIHTKHVGTA